MDFDTQFFVSIFPETDVKDTVYIMFRMCRVCNSFCIRTFLEICFTSRFKILRTLAGLYISYFRSTPYITQLFIFYFGLPQIFPVMRNLVGGTVLVITIAMNSAAFISEVIRGGLLAVDKGQREAALSIGLSPVSAYKEVILPQAFVAAFPSIGKFIYFHDKKYCDRIYDRGCRYTCTGQNYGSFIFKLLRGVYICGSYILGSFSCDRSAVTLYGIKDLQIFIGER